MRLPSKTKISFALLMSLSVGLGACAAHRRDGVEVIRAKRDVNAAQATAEAKRAALLASGKIVDINTLISANNKGTYQLTDDTLTIVKMGASNAVTPVADVALAGSQQLVNTTLPNTGPQVPLHVNITDKDVNLADILPKIPSVVNEFSAADGSVLTSRKDAVALQDKSATQYEEEITLSKGEGKISDKTAFAVIPVIKQLQDGSLLITRSVILDSVKGIATQEQLTYVMSSAQPGTTAVVNPPASK